MTDENDDRDEARLRASFDAQRNEDAAQAPSFDRTWAAAQQRTPRSSRLAIGAVVLAAAAAIGLAFLLPSADQPSAEIAPPMVALVDPEPLAFLLRPLGAIDAPTTEAP